MKGKVQLDFRRHLGAPASVGIAHKLAGLAVMTALVLAAPPAFAQSSLDERDAVAASADSADATPASDTSAPAADAADDTSDSFAPAAGSAIVAPDSGYSLPPPNDGSLADPASSPDDSGSAAIEPAPAADASPGALLPGGGRPLDAPLAAAAGGSGSAPHSASDRDSDAADNDNTGDGDSGNPVLEVPQVLPSADASAGNGANQSAQDTDSPPPDQLGSVTDYQDEQDYNPMAMYINPASGPVVLVPPYAASSYGFRPPASLAAQRGAGSMLPSGMGGIRPLAGGMNSAIMPTSPIYPRTVPMVRSYPPMAVHGSAPIPGGWWNRAR